MNFWYLFQYAINQLAPMADDDYTSRLITMFGRSDDPYGDLAGGAFALFELAVGIGVLVQFTQTKRGQRCQLEKYWAGLQQA